jgi:hypothetical protein
VLYCVAQLFTCVIVVHEIHVNDNDLYVVVIRCLVAVHVDYYHVVVASIIWLYIVVKSI